MTKKMRADGFSPIGLLVAILVIATICLGGRHVWHKNSKTESAQKPSSITAQTSKTKSIPQVDPTDGGKYLFIKEWDVRTNLPQTLQGKITYTISEALDPDTNLPLQAAKIFIKSETLAANGCATTETSAGTGTDSGAQYIRSDNSKPFNAARYRWTFKKNILTVAAYSFHLNYVTPDCIGSGPNTATIESLQTALFNLEKYN
jgi:hypothetical protein